MFELRLIDIPNHLALPVFSGGKLLTGSSGLRELSPMWEDESQSPDKPREHTQGAPSPCFTAVIHLAFPGR